MRILSVSLLAAMSFAVSLAAAPKPKNVILFIGDGMGAAHFTAARFIRGENFKIGTMPVIGLSATSSADRAVTDSAAAATALATGVKTNYTMVGVAPDGTPRRTVLEAAEANSRATGLVTTSQLYDASPAAFAAHSTSRYRHPEIIRQMLASGAELIAGGGAERFGRDDVPPLAESAATNGYDLETTLEGMRTSAAAKVLAVFPDEPRERDFRDARLPDLTRVAIERLSSDADGFFLMVEHEGTDTGSHTNDGAVVRDSLTSLDEAVGAALDFAARDGNTLVVVTGDHETGGLRISEFSSHKFRMEWSTTDHTAAAVPVFAFGPGAEAFGGFHENSEIGGMLLETQE